MDTIKNAKFHADFKNFGKATQNVHTKKTIDRKVEFLNFSVFYFSGRTFFTTFSRF
jgi:hypothetical protein